eukprot:g42583.t1
MYGKAVFFLKTEQAVHLTLEKGLTVSWVFLAVDPLDVVSQMVIVLNIPPFVLCELLLPYLRQLREVRLGVVPALFVLKEARLRHVYSLCWQLEILRVKEHVAGCLLQLMVRFRVKAWGAHARVHTPRDPKASMQQVLFSDHNLVCVELIPFSARRGLSLCRPGLEVVYLAYANGVLLVFTDPTELWRMPEFQEAYSAVFSKNQLEQVFTTFGAQVLVINQLVAAMLWYWWVTLHPPVGILTTVQKKLVEFFWDKRQHCVNAAILCLLLEEDGRVLRSRLDNTSIVDCKGVSLPLVHDLSLLDEAVDPDTLRAFEVAQACGGLLDELATVFLELDISPGPRTLSHDVVSHNLSRTWCGEGRMALVLGLANMAINRSRQQAKEELVPDCLLLFHSGIHAQVFLEKEHAVLTGT